MNDQILEPGLHPKIPLAVYLRQPSYSASDLCMAENLAKLHFHKTHPDAGETTDAQDFGSAFHCRILEPEEYMTRFAVSPFDDFRAKGAQEWRNAALARGLTVVRKAWVEDLAAMERGAKEHPAFATVFGRSGELREITMVASDPGTGLLLRARCDVLPPGNVLVDLKSTIDASPEGFGKQVWNLSYGLQASHYLHVYNLLHPDKPKSEFVFFAYEKEPPYLSAFYSTPYLLLEYCAKLCRARRYSIANAEKTGEWPGYPQTIDEFVLPGWAVHQIEEAAANG